MCDGARPLVNYCSQVPPRSVFVRIMHENHETASAKMSVLCSLQDNRILPLNSTVCVHHVAVSGEAVNSNEFRNNFQAIPVFH